jgi:pyruvate formate lyase activating enzyme
MLYIGLSMNSCSKIHSIETCGTVDGPGIRYVIFMQGCALRCKYCHNPDTWETSLGKLVSSDDLIKDILTYKPYMDFSGGGITVSGGEPLLHIPFLINLFKKCKQYGISTAIDTSGYVKINKELKELMNFTDLVLLDIKHIDDEIHKKLTGVSNKHTLEFARFLNEKSIKVWIRYVVVSGYTEDIKYAVLLSDFISQFSNVEKVELLPYHQLGKHKWEALGLNYELMDTVPPSNETINALKEIFKTKGIEVI